MTMNEQIEKLREDARAALLQAADGEILKVIAVKK